MGTAQNLIGDKLFKELTLMVKQAQHDYASPVMSISSIAKFSKNLSADERNLLERSIERINGIISGLKQTTSSYKNEAVVKASKSNSMNLSRAIEHLVTEKRVSLANAEFIKIKYDFSKVFKKLNFDFDSLDLNRIISNILQNSIEAMDTCGDITIAGDKKASKIAITIKDSGKGIPKHIQKQIGQLGFSYGKTNGSGLGLASAIRQLKPVGGHLYIKSRPGWGTRITIEVPLN